MFIAKQGNLIIATSNSHEELVNNMTASLVSDYTIEETDVDYVLYEGSYITQEEATTKKRERINLLSMTKREMFLGLYQAKGITPDMLKAQITDPQALIEFEYANDYYRGNPLIDVIGAQLGFTTEQLDKFFMSKDYHELLPVEPEEPVVEDTNANTTDTAV